MPTPKDGNPPQLKHRETMAIIGLTDTGSITAAYPTIGKLRKGAPKPGSAPGRDLDHFRFTSDNPDVLAAFEAAYPTTEKKRQINCLVVGLTPDTALDSWYEHWDASKMTRRCNGQTIEVECGSDGRYISHQGLSEELRPKCKGCPRGGVSAKESCKPVGRLSIVVKELLEAGYVGRVTVETHSLHDLRQLAANLQKSHQDFGMLDRVPFILRRVETEVSMPKSDGSRAKVRKWLLQLEPSAKWVSAQIRLAESRQFQQLTGHTIDVLALPDADDFDSDFDLPALPSAPSPNSLEVGLLHSFYRSLGLTAQDYDRILRDDLAFLNQDSLTSDSLPHLVGVRMAAVAAQSYPAIFGEDYGKGYESAKTECSLWLRQSGALTQQFKDRQYAAIGMAWIEHLDELEASPKTEQATANLAAAL